MLKQIGRLYAGEAELREQGADADTRRARRQRSCKPIHRRPLRTHLSVLPLIPAQVFPMLWFLMFAARLPSFNALMQLCARPRASIRWLGTRRFPSAKELAID